MAQKTVVKWGSIIRTVTEDYHQLLYINVFGPSLLSSLLSLLPYLSLSLLPSLSSPLSLLPPLSLSLIAFYFTEVGDDNISYFSVLRYYELSQYNYMYSIVTVKLENIAKSC